MTCKALFLVALLAAAPLHLAGAQTLRGVDPGPSLPPGADPSLSGRSPQLAPQPAPPALIPSPQPGPERPMMGPRPSYTSPICQQPQAARSADLRAYCNTLGQ